MNTKRAKAVNLEYLVARGNAWTVTDPLERRLKELEPCIEDLKKNNMLEEVRLCFEGEVQDIEAILDQIKILQK